MRTISVQPTARWRFNAITPPALTPLDRPTAFRLSDSTTLVLSPVNVLMDIAGEDGKTHDCVVCRTVKNRTVTAENVIIVDSGDGKVIASPGQNEREMTSEVNGARRVCAVLASPGNFGLSVISKQNDEFEIRLEEGDNYYAA